MLKSVNKKPQILFCDEFLLAVDKPAGMLSIPDRYDAEAPVILSLLEKTYGKLFVVHRIDKDTQRSPTICQESGARTRRLTLYSTPEPSKNPISP